MTLPEPAEPGPRRTIGAAATWAVAIVGWLYYLTPLLVPGRTPPLSIVLLLVLPGLGGFVLLALRHRFPVVVPVLLGILLLIGPSPVGAAFAAVAHLARLGRSVLTVVLVGSWILIAKLGSFLVGPYAQPWRNAHTVELTVTIGGLMVAVLVGALGGSRETELRERAIADRALRQVEQARLDGARAAERERIAREMHDVLAHRLSLVAMHAGALAYRTDLDQQTARDTAALIQTNAKKSLAELREVLTDLRGAGTTPEPPQPTLTDLDSLINEARRHQPVELRSSAEVAGLPERSSRQAYRIVQEALTNARKHAPGAPVLLTLSGAAGGDLVITVSNPLTPLALPDRDGAGLGLVGIAERVGLAGGTVRHGSVGERFDVEVRMPWPDAS
ncbi:sensor histidine kinase [Microlunatus soli]|uniref:sensor histidine kinase n=1 Tax=Microlunatus soli TaxID=630515 RepID=UPI001560D878|nr:histidine kinase [Microlunatus soli]